jgi:hypothetical protein
LLKNLGVTEKQGDLYGERFALPEIAQIRPFAAVVTD